MRVRLFLLCTALLLTHLLFQVGLAIGPVAPDLAVVALLLASRAMSSGGGAALGFVFGLLEDAFAGASFGANVFALTVVGAAGACIRSSFADSSIPFLAVLLAVGKWSRDMLAWVASDPAARPALDDLALVASPLSALYAAAAGLAARLLFMGHPKVR